MTIYIQYGKIKQIYEIRDDVKGSAMELTGHRCPRCGAELEKNGGNGWKCKYCGGIFDDATAEKNAKQTQDLFDEAKRERINNIRRVLYDATTAEYISSNDIKNACDELKKYLPDDFRANFYEIAVGNNLKKLTSAIRKIDVEQNYDEIENIVVFLIKSLQSEYLLELNNLVERAYKGRDLQKFEKYATEISVQAEKVQAGVYETKLPREVFVAYSSKDMEKVSELVEVLESQNIKCFVAARNLRHGRGSVENYDKALKDAMDHCKSFVFVSSMNSRSLSCDALEIEIPYIQKQDIENAPPEYRNNYAAIPHRYKKPRVEYRIEGSKGFNAADQITGEFFDGYEWVLSPDEVAVRVLKQLVATPGTESEPSRKTISNKKYCVSCGNETDKSQKFCSNCGKAEFVDDIGEFIKIKNQRDMEERRRREEAERRRQEEERRRREEEERKKAAYQNVYNNNTSSNSTYKPSNTTVNSSAKNKSKVVAVLLAFFLGSLGIDQFYLGYTKRGVWRIVLTFLSCGIISGIWSLIDCFRIASGSLPLDPGVKPVKKKSGCLKTVLILAAIVVIGIIILVITVRTLGLGIFGNKRPEDDWNGGWVEEITNDNESEYNGTYDGIDYTYYYADGSMVLTGNGNDTIQPNFLDNIYINDTFVKDYVISLTVQGDVTVISDYAFSNLSNLRNVKLSSAVKNIGYCSFENCGNLSEMELGGVQYIGENAFNYCHSLTTVTLENVVEIGSYAFNDCENLTSFSGGENLNKTTSESFMNTGFYSSLSAGNPLIVGNTLIRVSAETAGSFRVDSSVARIAPYAFADCEMIEQIIIPESVNYIGEFAFNNTKSLDCVVYLGSEYSFNNNVAVEGNWNDNMGYEGTTLLVTNGEEFIETTDTYSNGLSFMMNAATGTYYVSSYDGTEQNVTIPRKYMGIDVTGIRSSAFAYNDDIISVTIPTTLKVIGNSAFYDCDNLNTVTVPNPSENISTLEEIGASVFYSCDSLDKFELGLEPKLKTVGEEAFSSTKFTESVSVGHPFYLGNMLIQVSGNESGTFEIPSFVTHIADYAFSSNGNIKAIAIPSDVTGIGKYAFSDMYNLREIIYFGTQEEWEAISFDDGWDNLMGNWVTGGTTTRFLNGEYDPETADGYTPGLSFILNPDTGTYYVEKYAGTDTEVIIPSHYYGIAVTGISSQAFYGNNEHNSSITKITVSGGITYIGEEVFGSCIALTEVSLPEGIKEIPASAFNGCTSLESIDIPSTVESIGNYAFQDCSALKNVQLSASLSTIGQYAFNSSGLVSIVIPENVTVIGYEAFRYCQNLAEIVIPNSVTTIEDYAFSNCYPVKITMPTTTISKVINSSVKESVKEIVLTDGKSIPENAFLDCNSLYKVTLHEGLTTISNGAFGNCYSLLSITIPSTVKGCGETSFQNCYKLVEIIDNSSRNIAQYAPYCIIQSTGESQVQYTDDGYAFIAYGDAYYLLGYVGEDTDLVLPQSYDESIYNIYRYAFYECNLTSVSIPAVGDIGDYAFYDCASLESVTIGNSASYTIGTQAFYSCDNLSSLTIGSGVDTIKSEAFSGCNSLEEITLPSTLNKLEKNVFRSCSSLASVVFDYAGEYGVSYSETTDPSSREALNIDNSVTNATYLKSTYTSYIWYKQ